MPRTESRLIPFLRSGLELNTYCNLKWCTVPEESFCVEFPRLKKTKNRFMEENEKILFDWFRANGRVENYKGYSHGKAVFQAALKKSVYLVLLRRINKTLYYKFATEEESEEKQRLYKQKGNGSGGSYHSESSESSNKMENFISSFLSREYSSPKTESMSSPFPESPASFRSSPSPESPASSGSYLSLESPASSGYHNGMDITEENNERNLMDESYMDNNLLPMSFLDYDELLQYLPDILENQKNVNTGNQENVNTGNQENVNTDNQENVNTGNQENVNTSMMESEPPDKQQSLDKPVEEIIPVPNDAPQIAYWECTLKVSLKEMLMLICEKRVDGAYRTVSEGQFLLVNDETFVTSNLIDPGKHYEYKKFFPCGGDQGCLFIAELH